LISEANMKTPIFQAHGDMDYTVSALLVVSYCAGQQDSHSASQPASNSVSRSADSASQSAGQPVGQSVSQSVNH